MLNKIEDAYGELIYSYLKGNGGFEIIERDDDYFEVSSGPKVYFSTYEEWPECERKAMEFARGNLLDVGCGAGRHALYLQEKGFDVLGIDNSPLALKVCEERGLKHTKLLSIKKVPIALGKFDTILMMGANFGLLSGFKRANRYLQKFTKITTPNGRIIAATRDPYVTTSKEHLQYHAYNRSCGRLSGQVRIRVRYKQYVTPFFDYLFVSKDEMVSILENTGWSVSQFIDGENGMYIAVIDRG